METISYEYTKSRSQFGLHPSFNDSPPMVESIQSKAISSPPDPAQLQWLESLTTTVELSCIAPQAAHEVSTERYLESSKGSLHTEGAWPLEVKTNEFVDRQRFVRRILNEPNYTSAIVELTKRAENVINQNNTIDLYEEYFHTYQDSDYQSTPPSARTLCVFRDPNKQKRAATKISWQPDSTNKLAIAYSTTQFQALNSSPGMPFHSYIWDCSRPNSPDMKLIPQSPQSTLVFNPRSPDHLVGGSYNGQINFWDLRRGSIPVETTSIEYSHRDPVYDCHWIQSRTGNEFCSISTDGQILWWDIRKLKKGYLDSMEIYLDSPDANSNSILYGATSMDYKSDAGATRFLIGTERGMSLLIDRKAKKDTESAKAIRGIYGANSSTGQHLGPVYSIQRNPFHLKYFATVGDWSAKVWMEDLKSPILVTATDSAYLTGGCWSPTRPGLFFTTKYDGTMDVWDFYQKQNAATLTQKISDHPATSIKIQPQTGKQVAIGDEAGTVTIIQLSRGLVELQKDEKQVVQQIFERETRREKNLEIKSAQRKRDQPAAAPAKSGIAPLSLIDAEDAETREILKRAEEEFYASIQLGGDESAGEGGASNDREEEKSQVHEEQEQEAAEDLETTNYDEEKHNDDN